MHSIWNNPEGSYIPQSFLQSLYKYQLQLYMFGLAVFSSTTSNLTTQMDSKQQFLQAARVRC